MPMTHSRNLFVEFLARTMFGAEKTVETAKVPQTPRARKLRRSSGFPFAMALNPLLRVK
jgi:hypothetical protein